MSTVAEVFNETFNDYLAARTKNIDGVAFTDFIFDDIEMTVFVCSKAKGDKIKKALEGLNNEASHCARIVKKVGDKEEEEYILYKVDAGGMIEEDELPAHKHLAQEEETK